MVKVGKQMYGNHYVSNFLSWQGSALITAQVNILHIPAEIFLDKKQFITIYIYHFIKIHVSNFSIMGSLALGNWYRESSDLLTQRICCPSCP